MFSAGVSDLRPSFALASALPVALRNCDPVFKEGIEGKEQRSPLQQGHVSQVQTTDYLSNKIPNKT